MAYLDENPRSPWYKAARIILSLLFAMAALMWWSVLGVLIECLPRNMPGTATCDSQKHWAAALVPAAAVALYAGTRWLERRDPALGLTALAVLTALALAPVLMVFA